MAKPPKKVPRPTSPEPSTTLPHPLPGQPSTAMGDSGANAASTLSPTLPAVPVSRPSVIISPAPASHSASSTARTADSLTLRAAHGEQSALAGTSTGERFSPPVYINPESVLQLKRKASSDEGFLYDKRNKSYVELHEGVVMVGKSADGWRQTYAGESTPTGQRVEQIPGSKLWREIDTSRQSPPGADPLIAEPVHAMAGPGRRTSAEERLSAERGTDTLMTRLLSREPMALDLSAGQWKNWGRTTRPASGESIEIDGLHYQTVAQNLGADSGLVYLQHPGFSPDRYDAFENMLRHEPSRQPKWALKREGQWKVLDNYPPFEMSPTQYVSTAFKHLSDQSIGNLARAVFNRASLPGGINGDGLSVMTLTYRYWLDKVNNEAPGLGLADPLLMLPKLPTLPGGVAGSGLLALPASNLNVLQRLDFDPKKFPQQWAAYTATPTATKLHELFVHILQDNGYTVAPSTRRLEENALVFSSPNLAALFILKLPLVVGDRVPRYTTPGSNFTDPGFLALLNAQNTHDLNRFLEQTEVAHLVGGVQQLSADHPTLFIVREG
ncbi:hypothetical protein [Pseudomonas retamae]|uniref:Uncharacterized protein n=1 Tax=Pseudomonas retamae TaxID=702110 RepID=A0ABW7DGA4_9PSED